MSIEQQNSKGNSEFMLPAAFKEYENQPVWLCSMDKKPISPHTGNAIGFNKPENWGTFSQVCEYIQQHPDKEIYPAIVVSKFTGDLICLDLDHVIDDEGTVSTWAQEVLQKFGTYTEKSLGGDGFHIFAKGKRPGTKTVMNFPNDEKLEIFDCQSSPKPIRLSLDILEGKDAIVDQQSEIDDLYNKYFQAQQPEALVPKAKSPEMTDEVIIDILNRAKNGEKFRSLFEVGDTSNYGGDDSAADQALVSLIAFYTQDSDQIDRIFRASKLCRDKWRDRDDYRKSTIQRALGGLKDVYGGSSPAEGLEVVLQSSSPVDVKFPVEVLPAVLRDVTIRISSGSGGDPAISGTAVQALSAIALQKKVEVIEKVSPKLIHYLVFLHTVIGNSAEARKTANTNPLLAPFEWYHETKKEEYDIKLSEYHSAKQMAKRMKTELEKDETLTLPQKARQAAEIDAKVEELKPRYYRLFTTDTTAQAYVMRLGETDGCYSIFSTDAGDIIDYIIGNKQSGTNDMIFVKVVTRDHIHVDRVGPERIGVSIDIPDPCGNLFLMTQEEQWIRFNTHPRLRGSGLLGRNHPVIISPWEKGYLEEEIVCDEALTESDLKNWEIFVEKLLAFEGQVVLKLSKDAQQKRREFNNVLQNTVGICQENHDVADIIHRAVSESVKRAALFHICDHWGSLSEIAIEIPAETYVRAVIMQKFYLSQAITSRRQNLGKSLESRLKAFVERWISKSKNDKQYLEAVSRRQLQQYLNVAKDEIDDFLEELAEADVVTSYQVSGAKKGRYKLDVPRAQHFLAEVER